MRTTKQELKEKMASEEIHCYYCGLHLRMFSEDYEGDRMWLFPLNDGEGGEAYMCEPCHKARISN